MNNALNERMERRIRLTKAIRKHVLEIAEREDIDVSDVISKALELYEKKSKRKSVALNQTVPSTNQITNEVTNTN